MSPNGLESIFVWKSKKPVHEKISGPDKNNGKDKFIF